MNDVATRRPATASGEQPAAVLVVFGITGDLAEGDDVPVAVPAGAGRSCPRRPILGMKDAAFDGSYELPPITRTS